MSETSPPRKKILVDLDTVITPPDAGNLTEATLKYEAHATRQAREAREEALAAHERLIALVKLAFAGVLLLGFFTLGVYLFTFKPGAT